MIFPILFLPENFDLMSKTSTYTKFPSGPAWPVKVWGSDVGGSGDGNVEDGNKTCLYVNDMGMLVLDELTYPNRCEVIDEICKAKKEGGYCMFYVTRIDKF